MKTVKYLLAIFFLYSTVASADYPEPADDPIIGKKLWVYYENSTCRDNFKIYKKQSTGDQYPNDASIQILVKNLDKTPFNWHAGAWYELSLNSDSSKGHITYNDMHASYGYVKNLYLTDGDHVDLQLLKDACVSNVSPEQKISLIDAEKKLILAQEKLIDEENQNRREKRESAKLAAIEAEKIKKEKLITDRLQARKDQQVQELKDAPENIKITSTRQFCEYYGQMLRGEYISDFGSASDLKDIIKKEANRRKIKVNEKVAKSQLLRLNISTCDLYASWGIPDDENKSVGSYGVHIQHIYQRSRTYVYSENGRVTSWQE